ncbi:endomembrane protein 70 domain-containing protein [Ditylenchus destructor]|nr:endomembrane protein 70 domain-containing protein [Ditylenchus destructor]
MAIQRVFFNDRKRWRFLLLICVFLNLFPFEDGFYVPGVAPKEFMINEPIDVRAIKLTSIKTVVPYEYYALPFCKPAGELHYKSENLGEVMRGDRIVNTPYEVAMKKDLQCHTLCSSVINAKYSIDKSNSELLKQRIMEDYHVHLLVDNLPCATRYEIPETKEVFFDHGYKLGWTDEKTGKVYVNNHLDIVLKYHEPTKDTYRVVGFEVHPRSIDQSKYSVKNDKECTLENSDSLQAQELKDGTNEIIWSYSVQWEASDIPWASRWDIYLNMKDVQIHWFSILNSLVVVICLTGFLSVIIIRTVRRDIAKYNRDEDVEDTLEETGWKLVHGDVFRPPRYAMLLVNLVGTGIQLIGMIAVTVSFACVGMLSPSSRGSLTSVAIFLYCFMGLIAGYHSGRLYKTLRGNKPKRCAFRTAILFPSLVLGTGFVLNFFLISKHSSGAIPFTTMIVLLALWFGIDLPLVFLGFHFGFRKQMYNHPVRTNQIPRQVPDQPWYLKTFPCMLLAGILPFGAVFIELYFIFSAIWENQFYYLFGFLFIVLTILYVSCSQIAIVVTYFMLCAENYHWWWKSFAISGGSALYVMAYSVFYYYSKLNIIGFVPTLLYFTYSSLIALTFWILTGTIGFYAAYFFLRRIYGAVKID